MCACKHVHVHVHVCAAYLAVVLGLKEPLNPNGGEGGLALACMLLALGLGEAVELADESHIVAVLELLGAAVAPDPQILQVPVPEIPQLSGQKCARMCQRGGGGTQNCRTSTHAGPGTHTHTGGNDLAAQARHHLPQRLLHGGVVVVQVLG